MRRSIGLGLSLVLLLLGTTTMAKQVPGTSWSKNFTLTFEYMGAKFSGIQIENVKPFCNDVKYTLKYSSPKDLKLRCTISFKVGGKGKMGGRSWGGFTTEPLAGTGNPGQFSGTAKATKSKRWCKADKAPDYVTIGCYKVK